MTRPGSPAKLTGAPDARAAPSPETKAGRLLLSPGLRRLFALLFLIGAAWLLWRALAGVTPAAIVRALAAIPPGAILASLVLTAGSYVCLSATEWLVLRAVRHPLSFPAALKVAVPAYALTNSAGFSPLTGTAIRLQLYRRRGLGPGEAAGVAALAGAAVTLSGLVTLGAALAIDPKGMAAASASPAWLIRALGVALTAPALLWFVAFRPDAPAWLGGRRAATLSVRQRGIGLGAGVGDWLLSGSALFVLFSAADPAALPAFLTAFVAGCLLSAASGVPGGLGVFEAIVLSLTAMLSRAHETAAALLLYRLIYSLGPLTLLGIATLVQRLTATGRPPRP